MPEAKVAYLAAVCPANNTGDALNALLPAGRTASHINTTKVRRLAALEVTQFRAEYLAFTQPKLLWPVNVRGDIATLADDTLSEIDNAQTLADAKTGAAIVRAWNAWPAEPVKVRKAVQGARLLLGLPPSSAGKSGCA